MRAVTLDQRATAAVFQQRLQATVWRDSLAVPTRREKEKKRSCWSTLLLQTTAAACSKPCSKHVADVVKDHPEQDVGEDRCRRKHVLHKRLVPVCSGSSSRMAGQRVSTHAHQAAASTRNICVRCRPRRAGPGHSRALRASTASQLQREYTARAWLDSPRAEVLFVVAAALCEYG
jgi:hypothetical protein